MNINKDYFVYPVSIEKLSIKNSDRVAIIDGDGSEGFPCTSLMKLSAYEKRHRVKEVRFIKLKHERIEGKLQLKQESLKQLYEIKDYDRVYASFIFTRYKPVIEQLRGEMRISLSQHYEDETGLLSYPLIYDEKFRIHNLFLGGTGKA